MPQKSDSVQPDKLWTRIFNAELKYVMLSQMNQVPTFTVFPIGYVKRCDNKVKLEIEEKYRPGLLELESFSHVIVIWWADACEHDRHRIDLQTTTPHFPNVLTGLFATRIPSRPNPINITPCRILSVDHAKGVIEVKEIDAFDNTPILDLKAYFPTADRLRTVRVPERFREWGEWALDEVDPPKY